MVGQLAMSPARVLAGFTPVLLALFAVVLVNLPVTFTNGVMPAPLLALIPIYFWVLVRPDLMPPAAVLVTGIAEDLLSGGPPGIWATGFLAAYAITNRQREFFAGLSDLAAVIGFAAAVFAAAGAAYVLAAILFWRPAPLSPLLLEAVVTVAFYPLIAPVVAWIHRHIVGALRGDD